MLKALLFYISKTVCGLPRIRRKESSINKAIVNLIYSVWTPRTGFLFFPKITIFISSATITNLKIAVKWEIFKNFVFGNLPKILLLKYIRLTSTPKLAKDYGLKDQVQRSAVSIASNIAEGDELGSDKQSIRFFYISKGSVAELTTQLIIANEIGYIDNVSISSLLDDCDKISAMLTNLIKARNKGL